MNTKNPIYFFCGALLGGAIGATTALMLTPESGAEMRNQLRRLVLNDKQKRKQKSDNTTPSRKTKSKKVTTKRVNKKEN